MDNNTDWPLWLMPGYPAELTPQSGLPGAPVATHNPNHQPIVPTTGGVPPRCTCGVVGGNGIERPLLADHLREMDPNYA